MIKRISRKLFLLTLGLVFTATVFGAAPKKPVKPKKPEPRLDIRIKKNRSKSSTSKTGRQETYEFEVLIKNTHPSATYKDYVAELYVLSEDNADSKLLERLTEITSSFTLKPRAEHSFKADLIKVKYYKKSGTKLGGHLLLIRDEEGDIVKILASKPAWAKPENMDKIFKNTRDEFKL